MSYLQTESFSFKVREQNEKLKNSKIYRRPKRYREDTEAESYPERRQVKRQRIDSISKRRSMLLKSEQNENRCNNLETFKIKPEQEISKPPKISLERMFSFGAEETLPARSAPDLEFEKRISFVESKPNPSKGKVLNFQNLNSKS